MEVILFRYDKEDIFERFAGDVISNVRLLSLPKEFYGKIAELKKNENLDFDDAYQYSIAKIYKLKLVTMNRDFEKIKDVDILFL
ncbi:MAG: PIN domain-containing protein [Ignavibacteria bacterium]